MMAGFSHCWTTGCAIKAPHVRHRLHETLTYTEFGTDASVLLHRNAVVYKAALVYMGALSM